MRNVYKILISLAILFGCVGYSSQPNINYVGESRVYIVIGASNATNYLQELPRAFKTEMQNLTGDTIYVLNCAKAKSGLDDWEQGSIYYNNCMNSYNTNYANKGVLSGIVFVNGEHEMLYGTEWYNPFVNLVAALRQDLNSPELSIGFLQVHRNMNGAYVNEVRQQQYDSSMFLGACMINADDLKLTLDGLHYTKSSLTEIGKRFVVCY